MPDELKQTLIQRAIQKFKAAQPYIEDFGGDMLAGALGPIGIGGRLIQYGIKDTPYEHILDSPGVTNSIKQVNQPPDGRLEGQSGLKSFHQPKPFQFYQPKPLKVK